MKIAAISSRKLADQSGKEGHTNNGFLYNDKEFFDEADLNWYDYGFRHYDAQIGRFVQIDPLTDELAPLSGYHYAYNDPINHIDLDGLIGIPCPGTSPFTILLQNIGQFIASQAPTVAAAFALNGSAALASGLMENGRQKSETKQAGQQAGKQESQKKAPSQQKPATSQSPPEKTLEKNLKEV